MTYKQIEASREIRLWIMQIIAPVGIITAVALRDPEIRNAIKSKATKIKDKFKTKSKK